MNTTAHTAKLLHPIEEDQTRGGRFVARLHVAFQATAPGRKPVHLGVRLYDDPGRELFAAAPAPGAVLAITGGIDRDVWMRGGEQQDTTYIVATAVEILSHTS